MRIDAHVHFLDPVRFPYASKLSEPGVFTRAWLPEELSPVLARNTFDGCIAVQSTTAQGEAEWLIGLAERHPFIRGVVAWVNLEDAGLGHRLDQLQRNPCFRGVLHSVLYEEDEPWLERLNVHEGLSEIARRGLPVDLLLRPQHLKQIHELADASPALQLILDHLGTSAVERDGFDSWAGEMERLSEVPHLSVKISGLIAHAESKTRLARHLRPCVQHVWHLFGPDRCLFGSGWPVLQDAGTWKQALATFTQALGPLSKELRAGVIGVNAARVYRL